MVMHREESGATRATTATSPGKPEREARPESSRSRNVPSSGFTGNGSATAAAKTQAVRGQDGGSRRSSEVKNENSSKVAEAEEKKAEVKVPPSRSPIQREDSKGEERQAKRFISSQDDTDRQQQKRRKVPHATVDHVEAGELVRPSERERFLDQRMAGHDTFEKGQGRERVSNIRGAERESRAQERLDREEYHRDRSLENFGRERSSDRALFERVREKEDRSSRRYMDPPGEQPHPDDRFPMQNQPQQGLPPPPPVPPNVVPRTVSVSRLRVEEALEGRSVRNFQRLSPRPHDKPDKRHTDAGVALEEPRKRREDDARNTRKRIDDRELQAIKVQISDQSSLVCPHLLLRGIAVDCGWSYPTCLLIG